MANNMAKKGVSENGLDPGNGHGFGDRLQIMAFPIFSLYKFWETPYIQKVHG